MRVTFDWEATKNFAQEEPKVWQRLLSFLKSNEIYDEGFFCYVSDRDNGNRICFQICNYLGEKSDVLEYGKDELITTTKKELKNALHFVVSKPGGKHLLLLQTIFDSFLKNGDWPNSRECSAKMIGHGNYYKMAKEIGAAYVKVGKQEDIYARSRLSIFGVSVCDNSEHYIKTFINSLIAMLDKYKSTPKKPIITGKEFVAAGIVSEDWLDSLYWMIYQEEWLWDKVTGESYKNDFAFTISPNILDFVNIKSISRYWGSELVSQRIMDDLLMLYKPKMKPKVSRKNKKENTKSKYKYDIFISYFHADEVWALEIKEEAEKKGITTFLSEKSIESGDIGEEEIKQALIHSREVAFLMTPGSVKSEWVIKEWGATWVLGKRATPILYRCDIINLPVTLQSRQARDFSDLNRYFEEVLKRRKNA